METKQTEFPLTTNTFRTTDLQKWDVFKRISPSFLRTVRLGYVYDGHNAQTGILVTNLDEVFTVGINNNGSGGFGRGTDVPIEESRKVVELCGKNVQTFISTRVAERGFCLALTASGQVYSWGDNVVGQLGLGHFDNLYVPHLISGELAGKRVTQLACAGGNHCFAVTENGHVYGWGYNEGHGRLGLGEEDLTNKSSPVRINLLPEGIRSITCGGSFTYAITQDGEVYIWGDFRIATVQIQGVPYNNSPVKLNMFSKIVKIVCGRDHAMALDSDGELYVWGKNGNEQFGQIGHNFVIPKKISKCIGVIQDIFASPHSNLAICKTSRGLEVWGSEKANQRHDAEESFNDVILLHYSSQFMQEPLIARERHLSLAECMENAFIAQDELTTDVTFKVQGEKIHAHKGVLLCRNEYFQTMFSKKWKESGERNIELGSDINYKPFYALLYYIYSETIMIHEDQYEDLLDLAIQADFCLEKTLKKKCFDTLRRRMNYENVLDFCILAREKQSEELMGRVLDVVSENLRHLLSTGKIDELNLTAQEHSRLLKSIADLFAMHFVVMAIMHSANIF